MYFYVIMPVGADKGAQKKQAVIKRVAGSVGLHAHFPGYSTRNSHFDLEGIIEEIKGAAFVLADLSLERPSCYYELGLAQSLGKTIYLLAQSGTDIHQTASRSTAQFFGDLPGFEKVIENIIASGKQALTVK